MEILTNKLYPLLENATNILIYGAGVYANELYSLLKGKTIKDKIEAFVVTRITNNNCDIDGIPIIPLCEIKSYNLEKYTLLVAADEVHSREMVENLKEYNVKELLKLTDFILDTKSLNDISDEQFCDCIKDLYIWQRINSVDEYKKRKAEEIQKIEYAKKTIVFIIGYPNVRVVRIMGALLRKDYKIVALKYGNMPDHLVKSELLSNNLEYIKCSGIGELFYKAMQYKPLVYYFEPLWGDCSYAEVMINHKRLYGKIVLSLYDVLNDSYVQESDEQKRTEKYALENADGIVWRYFSKEYLAEKKGFVYKGKPIQFLDCCTGYEITITEPPTKKLNLCCVCGRMGGMLFEQSEGVIEDASLQTILNNLGNRDDCELHVFTGIIEKNNKKICSSLEKKYYNFKIFEGIEHNELIQQISKYDYGCVFFTDGEDVPDMMTVDDNIYYGSSMRNTVANRFFDYIDAELPIVASRPLKLCEVFDEYGIRVNMNVSNMDINYLIENRAGYKERVIKAKKDLLIDNQIRRLIDFFEEL